MRYLKTPLSCKRLKQKQKNPPDNKVKAKRAWRRFNKKDTRKACYKLQQGICAYSEVSLNAEPLGNHLEHIAPRSRFPERTFLPDNLVLSALDDTSAGALSDSERFAGHHKKSQYEDDWFISPYQRNCEHYFLYCALTGQVAPSKQLSTAERSKAERTIAVLNLNCDYLIEKRRKQLEVLDQKITSLLYQEHITTENQNNTALHVLQQLTEEILVVTNKQLPEFYTAKKQLLESYRKQLA